MSPRFLNFIIALSIIGISGVLLKEKFFPAPAGQSPLGSAQVASAQETAETTPAPAGQSPLGGTDPLVPCQSSYFNFRKGTAWKYKMTVGTTFTSTVVENTESSATISTKIASVKDPITSTLTCKKSGIYGLPFIPITSKKIPSSIMESILFIPPDSQLSKTAQWDSVINVGVQIPLIGNGITIHSKVREYSDDTVTIGSNLNIGTSMLPGNITPDKNGNILEYALTKGVGASSLTVAGVKATLVGFNPAGE